MSEMKINNRVTAMTGTDFPIIQAPMGWIARAQLASAVSNAGGMGIIETSSGELDAIKIEVEKMRQLTDKPFGMNVALSYVKGTNIIDFVIEQGIRFVTTSSGSPSVCTKDFQQAGIKVFHVVPTLDMALKAMDAGVDGLIVEGGEGGGFKNPSPVSTMVFVAVDSLASRHSHYCCGWEFPTACRWPVRLPWVQRVYKWERVWCRALNLRYTTIGRLH